MSKLVWRHTYFDVNFKYKRKYVYQDKKINKIFTSVKDSISEDFYVDKFIIEKK